MSVHCMFIIDHFLTFMGKLSVTNRKVLQLLSWALAQLVRIAKVLHRKAGFLFLRSCLEWREILASSGGRKYVKLGG